MSVSAALILAAGKGTRMKSGLVKVLHELAGRPMLGWPLAAAREAGAAQIVVVAGHQADLVQKRFATDTGIRIALQEEQLGTGHAVSCSLSQLGGLTGSVLILCGDTPLLTGATLQHLASEHAASGAAVTVLTARLDRPFGYGRIVRDSEGRVRRIVEQKDASPEEQAIDEVNSGIYCMDLAFLRDHIGRLGSENAQNEYYLTDLVGIAVAEHAGCAAVVADDPDEIMGVNDRVQLAHAASVLRQRINLQLMLSGVTLVDPAQTYIDAGVQVGSDTIIWPGCVLRGSTTIGSGCELESNVQVTDCSIADRVHLKAGSVLAESQVFEDVAIGPMAHLRPGTVLQAQVKIGNFVETKKVVMGVGSKASHLTYLGDAEVGRDVNIGCGTITCNYDGKRKHKTVIGDGVFVGSDVQLVAPVTVGANALIAAGTTVTQDVPPDSLAIARTPQVNKDGWCLKKRDNA
ncbi:UDP-N-acetylglucosamine pyrophosphorylase /glucosamine-1-phosphate N-acetyltransferase [Trichlorobacter thiogenes]|uniref:Bifunctional protein GlmU n=1 Tax=Trichlorobacter thiogenes TaxID=115783 RepID=A0A1T4Q8J9_9BACT|nr:bifunctional UDP-N-acetylglucosamine diphosphorylase/glucosamine-1-phosphate N-acetyltransferase GlmU [Trichlorobacter thiogenes]SKA00130.1 UDP-N-acetylglucosamine pyrophosphorylase /glucosamine-1-phosphate N-acetyltransferase [Trichlorobacter thiogenes]